MKIHTPFILFTCIILQCISPLIANHNTAVNPINEAIASNDPQRVINALPALEKVWPDRPDVYFESAKRAASTLSASQINLNNQQALSQLFTNMVHKDVLSTSDTSASLIELKCETIRTFMNSTELKKDPSTWITLAEYIGRVRSRIIPNYVKKGSLNPHGIMDADPVKAQEIMKDNRRLVQTDSIQQALNVTNSKLTFLLIHSSKNVSVGAGGRQNFIEKIVGSASLKDEERRQLE